LRKDSSLTIDSFADLLVDGLRLSMGDPEQAAIGRTIRASLRARSSPESDLWQRLEAQVKRWGVFKPTVNDVANDVQIGAVDAGIVWDTTVSSPAYQRTLNLIELPEISSQSEQVTLAVLSSSTQPAAAWKFARYLTDPAQGQQIFRSHGFRPVPLAARHSALDEVGSE
jgi:molybdate transport system substrate-binding protein